MRTFKILGALMAVLAFSAIGVATATAAETLWRWLPGSAGETFTGEQPAEGKLVSEKTKSEIKCAKGKLTAGELLKEGTVEGKDATLALATLHFEGCKAGGILPANSLGDGKEIILVHVEIHNCVIKAGEFGLLILPLEVHIEVPSVGLLIIIFTKGLFIAVIASEGGSKEKFTILAKQEAGKQKPEKCEGGEKETLKIKVDNEPEENAGLEAHIKIKTGKKIDVAGEEIMV